MAEIAVDGGNHVYVARNAGYGAQQVDCGFEAASEEAGAGEEEVPD